MGFGILALAIGLAACGGDEPEQEEAVATPEEEPVTEEQDMGSIIDTENIPDIIATVNGEDIEKGIYVSYLQQQASQMMMQGIDLESEEGKGYLEMIKESTIQQLVNERLIVQAANEENLKVTEEEIDQEIKSILAEFQLETEAELQELIAEQGVTMDELRDDIVEYLKRDKYIQQNINVKDASEEELQAAYDEILTNVEDETEVPEFDDYREELQTGLQSQQEQEQTVQLLEDLREASEITIHLS